jgi:hypothetical protein
MCVQGLSIYLRARTATERLLSKQSYVISAMMTTHCEVADSNSSSSSSNRGSGTAAKQWW